jgi:hypothetical protein
MPKTTGSTKMMPPTDDVKKAISIPGMVLTILAQSINWAA